MKLFRLSLLFSIIIVFSMNNTAQERIHVKKKDFFVMEDGFKEAWKAVKKGNFQFYQHRPANYKRAVEYYKKALEYNPDYPEVNLLMAISLLRSDPKSDALPYIQTAIDLKPDIHPRATFFLARALHMNMEFSEAIDEYEAYKESLEGKQLEIQSPKIDKYISECEAGERLKKANERVIIENLGENINSPYDDYGAILSADGGLMVFTSRRGEHGDRYNPIDNKYFEDIYTSSFEDKEWTPAVSVGSPVNTKWNDAAVAFSEDGQKLIFYRGRKRGGDLYVASLNGTQWGNIHDITHKLNHKKSQETAICFDEEGTTAYFISTIKDNNYGGKDIYYSIQENGKWSQPINLGETINTPYDEGSIYITPDERYLFFSSKGHNSIGGYDIFVSEYKDDHWTEPKNLGMPLNTPDDDMFMYVLMNGRDAFFSSVRKDGLGGFDIYHAILLGPEKPLLIDIDNNYLAGIDASEGSSLIEESVQIHYTRMTIVKGTVTDYNTGMPVSASIELVDNATGKLIKRTSSNINTGAYLITLPSGKDYGFSVNADGYMFHSENFVVPATQEYKEIFKDIQLQPITPGSKIILHNTFFDSGKSSLRPESYSELNRLAKLFEKHPNLVIEISGHTDNRGSKAVNKRLSYARAKAVVDYLIGQGVNPANLKAVGYDFQYPVASNNTAEGRQMNRRVEAKVISN